MIWSPFPLVFRTESPYGEKDFLIAGTMLPIREYKMIYRGPGFLPVVLVGYSPSPVSKLDRRHRGRLRKRGNLLTVEGGKGASEEPNHTTARKPSPL